MLRYALLGRTGSGRRFFQQLLETNGFKVAKSYTTRERKDDNDNQHHFIENIHSYDNERVLETHHNGCAYFYTMKELENADIIPIDPENIENLCNLFPDDAFRFLELVASNENRLIHAVADADDKITAEEDFVALCEEENETFSLIEDKIGKKELDFNNMIMGHVINNDFTKDADMFSCVEWLKESQLEFNRMRIIIEQLGENGNIDVHDGKYTLVMIDKDSGLPYDTYISKDMFAENTLSDPNGVCAVMKSWLRLKNISFKE